MPLILRAVLTCPEHPTDGTQFMVEFVLGLQEQFPDWQSDIAVNRGSDNPAFQVTAESAEELWGRLEAILSDVECHPGLCLPGRPGIKWWPIALSGCFARSA